MIFQTAKEKVPRGPTGAEISRGKTGGSARGKNSKSRKLRANARRKYKVGEKGGTNHAEHGGKGLTSDQVFTQSPTGNGSG